MSIKAVHLEFFADRHSEDLIKRLEQAGLGYHVDAEKTTDRMGQLVCISCKCTVN